MCAVSAPLIAPVVLLLNDTDIMWYGNRVEHGCTKIYTNKIRHHLIYECPRIKDSHNPARGFSDYDRFDLSQIDKFYSMLSFVHASVHYIVSSFLLLCLWFIILRRISRYQKCNQNP